MFYIIISTQVHVGSHPGNCYICSVVSSHREGGNFGI